MPATTTPRRFRSHGWQTPGRQSLCIAGAPHLRAWSEYIGHSGMEVRSEAARQTHDMIEYVAATGDGHEVLTQERRGRVEATYSLAKVMR